ncbi:MAG TPA: hypothetical protein VGP79_02000, partial [Bryobacteraceae bacterium]|nr:hypothetical protein [Bryobacteraceae bacterium]
EEQLRPSEIAPPPETPAAALPPPEPAPRFRNYWIAALVVAMIGATAAFAFWSMRKPAPAPKVQQITFRRGSLTNARFAPGGQSVVYSAQWDRDPIRLYTANLFSPDTKELGFENSLLGALSRGGELALTSVGTGVAGTGANLTRVPMNGGEPLCIAKKVAGVEWDRDGKQLIVIRLMPDQSVLEYPMEHEVYKSPGTLSHMRLSPDGTQVAFLDHPIRGDDAGNVVIVQPNGKSRAVSIGWASIGGLAWAPSGREIWFTAAKTGAIKSLWAATLEGKVRPIAAMPGPMILHDISTEGRVLISGGLRRTHMMGMLKGDTVERDFSLFDWSAVEDISADGNLLLFDESGEGGGANWAVYLHNAHTGANTRLGDGRAGALAPDGSWVAVIDPQGTPEITLVPVGEGARRKVATGGLTPNWVRYFPDGQRLLITGSQKGGKMQLSIVPLDGSPPIALGFYFRNAVVSPDGLRVAGMDADGRASVAALNDGAKVVLSPRIGLLPLVWTADGKAIVVQHSDGPDAIHLSRLDIETGRLTLIRDVMPADPVGFRGLLRVSASASQNAYAYTFLRALSELYVVDGWR